MSDTPTRQRSTREKMLIAAFEKRITELGLDSAAKDVIIRELQVEVRNLKKRLHRFEKEPPLFELPVMRQIKLLKHFGLTFDQLAELYATSPERIERVCRDEDAPKMTGLRPLPAPAMHTGRLRAIQV